MVVDKGHLVTETQCLRYEVTNGSDDTLYLKRQVGRRERLETARATVAGQDLLVVGA